MRTSHGLLFLAAACRIAAQSQSQACALVADELKSRNDRIVNGQRAQDCLLSLPFDADKASTFLKELRKYIEHQSTLEILKNPPDSYLSPAVDILGGLDKIASTTFKSHYEFDTAVNNLIRSANDGHLYLQLCSLEIFQFFRPAVDLMSVSDDGFKLPELYFVSDAKLLGSRSNAVSPVTSINDEDATAYLQKVASRRGSQDPDARWNQLFLSQAEAVAEGSNVVVHGAFINDFGAWPGANATVVQFRNGSKVVINTVAKFKSSRISPSPQVLFSDACLSQNQPRQAITRRFNSEEPVIRAADSAADGPKGYPQPFDRDAHNQILGFNLDQDTAVMFIPTFDTSGRSLPDAQSAIFADKAASIVQKAVASGRTKLIIDVSANGGGNIPRAFDLFKLFFPDKFPFSATRFRRHTAIDLVAKALGSLRPAAASRQGIIGFRAQVTPDQQGDFASLEDFLGNSTEHGVRVSSLFANFNYTAFSSDESPIRGFGAATDKLNRTQPFKPENIIIIGDGLCASTCTTFVNLMTNVGGVRTVAFGGRPQNGPMQLMGGVRGAQSVGFELIEDQVQVAVKIFSATNGKLFTADEQKQAAASLPVPLSTFPIRLPGGNVNFRNAYQENKTDLPLQFEHQAADCRLFFTAQNVVEPATTWTDAKKAMWEGGKCVDGSTGAKGSKDSNGTQGTKDGSQKNSAAVRLSARVALAGLAFIATLACAL